MVPYNNLRNVLMNISILKEKLRYKLTNIVGIVVNSFIVTIVSSNIMIELICTDRWNVNNRLSLIFSSSILNRNCNQNLKPKILQMQFDRLN